MSDNPFIPYKPYCYKEGSGNHWMCEGCFWNQDCNQEFNKKIDEAIKRITSQIEDNIRGVIENVAKD